MFLERQLLKTPRCSLMQLKHGSVEVFRFNYKREKTLQSMRKPKRTLFPCISDFSERVTVSWKMSVFKYWVCQCCSYCVSSAPDCTNIWQKNVFLSHLLKYINCFINYMHAYDVHCQSHNEIINLYLYQLYGANICSLIVTYCLVIYKLCKCDKECL